LPRHHLKEYAMPTDKRAVRLLLPPWIEQSVIDLARKEGRPIATLCVRLIEEALSHRRSATMETTRLVQLIRGEADTIVT
jgi:hypothetical protein